MNRVEVRHLTFDDLDSKLFHIAPEDMLIQIQRENLKLRKANFYWQAGFSFVSVIAIWLIAMRFI